MTQQSPVYGSCSPARCAYCGRVNEHGDVCHSCDLADRDPEQYWTWDLLRSQWWLGHMAAERCTLTEGCNQPPLYLQQRRALLRQAMAEGRGAW